MRKYPNRYFNAVLGTTAKMVTLIGSTEYTGRFPVFLDGEIVGNATNVRYDGRKIIGDLRFSASGKYIRPIVIKENSSSLVELVHFRFEQEFKDGVVASAKMVQNARMDI